jgi:PAP2 superfamily
MPKHWAPSLCACSAASTCFAGAYWLSNKLTSLRDDVGSGAFSWEHMIPFVPWTIVPYLSILVFFPLSFFVDGDRKELQRHVKRVILVLTISLVCYTLFPLRFTFERPLVDGPFGPLYALLETFDLPYNRAPSLHISVLVLLWARLAPRLNAFQRICLKAWFILIAGSVLTTYQHHIIDIPGGILVGAAAVFLTTSSVSDGLSRTFARRLSA